MALAHFSVTLAQKVKVGATVHKGASNTPESIFHVVQLQCHQLFHWPFHAKQFTEEDFHTATICCSVMLQL